MNFITTILTALGLIFLMAVILSFPTMWLWNWLMPVIFGLIKINFWQALGLNLLSGLLLKSTSK